ncbi:MAG: DUF1883 domain-containing protein [Solirubrobacteraceae bacterium]
MPGQQFQHYDLGSVRAGSTVVVTLRGNAANVRLLDSSNFSSYRAGRQHRYYGGLAQRSPVHLSVPRDGHWHVAIDLQGLGGQVRSSVQVEPPPLPPLPPISSSTARPPLRSIADNVATVAPPSPAFDKAYDVFISHASEDKDAIVRDLANALRERGLNVWFDEFALRIGDNLRRKIDAGLSSSRFGVVILSPAFLAKQWPQYELDSLVTREMAGEHQAILPIWHNLSAEDVRSYSLALANKLALSTSDLSVDEIARQIAEVVEPVV